MEDILYLFHHIHHNGKNHEVHHCGGDHIKVDPKMDYTIRHCRCEKHSIDKQKAIGHASNEILSQVEVMVYFREECPDGGWHIESGIAK